MQGGGWRVEGVRDTVQGAGCRVQGAGCRVQGAGCRVCGALRPGGVPAAGEDPPSGVAGYEPLHATPGVGTLKLQVHGSSFRVFGTRQLCYVSPRKPRNKLRVERLRENLADFKEKCFQKSRNVYQDVTCKRSN